MNELNSYDKSNQNIKNENNDNTSFVNKENNINLNNTLNSRSDNINNFNNSDNLIINSFTNNYQVQIPNSTFNPSQFSFKPKSEASNSISNNNSFEIFKSPPKKESKNSFEKMLTVEKLRYALAPSDNLDFSKNDEIFHFKTDVKHFPKYPEFKRVTYDDLPELEIMTLDDIDKKSFNIYSKISFPPVEELAELMKKKDIKEEDFDFYCSISYLLFIKRKEFSPKQRQLIIKNIPFDLINDIFNNNQNYSNDNENFLNDISSFNSPSFSFSSKDINIICMIINIIILTIQCEEDMKYLIESYGKYELFNFIDNICYLLQFIDNFRLKRKILSLLTRFFQNSDEIILNYLRRIERIIDNYSISTNIIIKMQQILKNKQTNYINLLINSKNEIIEKIEKNDVEKICYLIKFLSFILSGSQGNYIFDENNYTDLFKFFRDLNKTNQNIEQSIARLKKSIKKFY